jgi:PTH2 family peptidyl-tRNA hydrolase
MNVKQVIVMRTQYPDGKGGTTGIRKGKLIAQGSHASMAFMSHYLRQMIQGQSPEIPQAVQDWINGSFAKVVLQADDEQTLLDIQKACEEVGVMCHLITDSGFTEFHGVPTNTAIAIGPDYSDKIDALTGPQGRFPLKLY